MREGALGAKGKKEGGGDDQSDAEKGSTALTGAFHQKARADVLVGG